MNVRIFLYVIVSLILIVFLKPENPTFSKLLTVMVSAIVAVTSINHLIPVMDFIKKLSDNSGFDNKYLEIILKCTAICFLGSFTSNLCKDNGENALVFSTEFICRSTIIVLSLPIYIDVVNWMTKLWQNT